ncbi:MAG: 3-hydroxyacyl-CoA dehydrogenase family protein [Desulfarculaceae bacterium]|nr:3-hydroxyacyl-CoA dehydrogenase family protein [Desulfarculaceae bacterium]MCF8046109.1 3-hydroxyacyl-CoA dehydrogenase family protein [Desulfarculaceae bacterium]MCF8063743.1 3-hydroxyacyl-CoA dehydrogenase family protein [Desulfarculaceae bacterium]MCF8097729.1 3-hydroxyacyl-CoA dehydrogenase family protein [Desulfarculaceae bacterium]MCF8121281.1 3-hydroxyacyl-CoA dehydrogenase family protein [Desulfarculaceae bacterium]
MNKEAGLQGVAGDAIPVAVIGAGIMGHGIAQIFGLAGHPVRLYDPNPEVLAKAKDRVRESLDSFVLAEMVSEDDAVNCLNNIATHAELASACQGAGLVVEAAPEKMDLKRELFAKIEPLVARDAILASNTSALAISEVARDLAEPGRFVGTHFWNPPQVIPCVEVIPGERTDPEVCDRIVGLLEGAGKVPVRLKHDIPGFLGNRLQHALQREALALVEEGVAEPEDVDRVVRYGFGLRMALMGPLERADFAGLETTLAVQRYLLPLLEKRIEGSPSLVAQVEQGRHGVKSGGGFYDWPPEKAAKRQTQRDRALLEIIKLTRDM